MVIVYHISYIRLAYISTAIDQRLSVEVCFCSYFCCLVGPSSIHAEVGLFFTISTTVFPRNYGPGRVRFCQPLGRKSEAAYAIP